MRYLYFLLGVTLLAPSVSWAQAPDSVAWERFFPTQMGDRWDYHYVWKGRCGPGFCTTTAAITHLVVGDTLVEGVRFPVFEVRRDGSVQVRCAVGVLPGDLWFTRRPVPGYAFACPVQFNSYMEQYYPEAYVFAVDQPSAPVSVVVGAQSYTVEAVHDADHWRYNLHTFASDLGTVEIDASDGGLRPINEHWTLRHAVVGGVEYGTLPAGVLTLTVSPTTVDSVAVLSFAVAVAPLDVRVEVRDRRAAVVLMAEIGTLPVGTTQHTLDVSSLTAGTYTIRAVAGDQVSPVEVAVVHPPPIPDALALSLYPNPAGASMSFVLLLPEQGPARGEVLDLLGRIVLTRDLGFLEAGEHTHTLDTSVLAPGTYVLRAVTPEGVVTRRFTRTE